MNRGQTRTMMLDLLVELGVIDEDHIPAEGFTADDLPDALATLTGTVTIGDSSALLMCPGTVVTEFLTCNQDWELAGDGVCTNVADKSVNFAGSMRFSNADIRMSGLGAANPATANGKLWKDGAAGQGVKVST